MADRKYDILTMGRSSIDLYSNDVGKPFVEIKSFGAFVGGCPTNISVGTRRLGLRSALLTAVGEDPVGDFIIHFLNQEQVETGFIPKKAGKRSSAVVLGIEPPDKFPLVYYRDNCADNALNINDVLAAPVGESRILLISGTGLSQEPGRSATLFAAERAKSLGTKVFLDVDFRADQWDSPLVFGTAIRSILPNVDLVLGTEDELKAAAVSENGRLTVSHSQVSESRIKGDLNLAIKTVMQAGPEALVLKNGASGSTVYLPDGEAIKAAGFPVEVYNVLGAGDAFASGFIYGYTRGFDWYKAARMGNACGAIVVTRHGCANFNPYEQEALEFIDLHGGF
ncbi:MAG: 5-dehydro-2-deoxygluconokinase [Balneolales bacterium]